MKKECYLCSERNKCDGMIEGGCPLFHRDPKVKELKEIKKVVWKFDYGVLIPCCPYCDEPAYDHEGCHFCQKPYEYTEKPKLRGEYKLKYKEYKILTTPEIDVFSDEGGWITSLYIFKNHSPVIHETRSGIFETEEEALNYLKDFVKIQKK